MNHRARDRGTDPPLRTLHAAALSMAARGWPVFPLRPGQKTPAIRSWEQRASLEPDQLADWWNRRPYNIGVACGPAHLVVLDLDRHPGDIGHPAVDGIRVLRDRATAIGEDPHVATLTVATPSGGRHLYFLAPADTVIGNTAGRLGPGVDSRSHGGYVVAPGSTRWLDGRRRSYRIVRDAAVAGLPGWIRTALEPSSAGRPAWAPVALGHSGAYIRAVVTGATTAVTSAPVGTRNITLFRASARLGELVAAGMLDESTARAELRRATATHIGVSGFTAEEADRAAANGIAHAAARHRVETPLAGH